MKLRPVLVALLAATSSFASAADSDIEAALARPGNSISPDIADLIELAARHRVVVLGETHGKREPAALLVELMQGLHHNAGYSYVALEGHEDRQVFVDQYLAGVDDDRALRRTLLGPELAQVLVVARRLNREYPQRKSLRVLLIDGPSSWNVSTLEQTRDQRMFRHLRRVLDSDPAARILVYVGNSHTTENLQLLDGAEGPGHRQDEFVLPAFRVAHLLELYSKGSSLSVRTVDPQDPIGRALKGRFGQQRKRLFIRVDGTPLENVTGCIEPGGSWNAALRDAPVGKFVDYLVAFEGLTPTSELASP